MAATANLIHKFPYTSLIVTGLLCGLLWRLELEYLGWQGLIWISYFHWALPAAFVLFLTWAIQFLDMPLLKRLVLCALASVYASLLFLLVKSVLYQMYATGPQAMVLLTENPSFLQYKKYGWMLLASLAPISVGFMIRIFELKVSGKHVLLSILSIGLSIPISIGLLMLVHHKGSPDFIHAIKSGFIIPLWVFSVGILFVKQERKMDL